MQDQLSHLKKRKHVIQYKEHDIPSKETIESILKKAWEVTPSKQNFMPYKIHVFGPEHNETKRKISNLTSRNQKEINQSNKISHVDDGRNAFYKHVQHNPYLFVITQRVCEPNDYVKMQIERNGGYYEQMHEEELPQVMNLASLEVGLFLSNLTSFAIEEGLSLSHCNCYPSRLDYWSEIQKDEVPIFKTKILSIVSIGKPLMTAETFMKSLNIREMDYKPQVEEIVEWI